MSFFNAKGSGNARPGMLEAVVRQKIIANSSCHPPGIERVSARLLDSLSLSRHGESSSEPGSVMILDPMFGNSLWKVRMSDSLRSHEQ